jgi:membrane-bound metal-dependent hydrolase YbcI (DUF457 family)
VLFWFAGTSLLAVWLVFRDPAIDHRLVVVGAILPDVLDGMTGGPWVFHSLFASVATLGIVMAATVKRRALRRQLIALPIGMFLHLVFDGAWNDTETFWWPFSGGFGDGGLPSLERGAVSVVLEVIGIAILVWLYKRWRLDVPANRERFIRTGRLARELAGPGPGPAGRRRPS